MTSSTTQRIVSAFALVVALFAASNVQAQGFQQFESLRNRSLGNQSLRSQSCTPTNDWRFGMNVKLVRVGCHQGLLIKSVVHGGPACEAGLKAGMVILSSNRRTFKRAYSNRQAISILQRSVEQGFDGGIDTLHAGLGHGDLHQSDAFVDLIVRLPCGDLGKTTCHPLEATVGCDVASL